MSLLDQVRFPADIRALPREQLRQLADEVRDRHIDVVAQKGGHFGASLGVVELTVALHRVYDTPRDQLVWDTGHQAYIHKILTGRNEQLPTIRTRGGLAPFLRRDESEYDAFGAGHAATSISAAWGMAVGRDLKGADFDVVAIIGDGSMGCGLAYEALNNAGHKSNDFTVVLNDNDMSIGPAVGALNKYLTSMVTNPAYNKVRDVVKDVLHRAPRSLGHLMEEVAGKLEDGVKHMLTPGMLFEALGFRYIGPVDGHDLDELVDTFSRVRKMSGPILVHVLTQKGKGFHLAEDDPWTWHAASPFDKISGAAHAKKAGRPRYQKVFGKGLVELADEDPRIVAITAAMPDGTSTDLFSRAHADRYFDVGIAEGHGVTFAAGLATQGIKPVVAIYSTFLQRGYDNIVHDVALQDLPVVFGMDRAGIAGADGPTHNGAFDIAYMLAVPNMTVTAGKNGTETLALLRAGLQHEEGPFCLRWPRDSVPDEVPSALTIEPTPHASWEVLRRGSDLCILAVGTMVLPAIDAAQELAARGIEATVVNCRYLKPYDRAVFEEVVSAHDRILTIEEGTVTNGFGAFMTREITAFRRGAALHIETLGLPDDFIEHGGRGELLADLGLDAAGIARSARALTDGAATGRSARETA
ncbi:1-deoxy-D-xylulose-5-phosphate synthase [Gaopeijia maritima]|uniref:1-deoxy-D-xylulose-5-phosphate synthase n=1 Tax=Gaopeijia maritima TaxID=3119007 RepID=UPI00324EF9F6